MHLLKLNARALKDNSVCCTAKTPPKNDFGPNTQAVSEFIYLVTQKAQVNIHRGCSHVQP